MSNSDPICPRCEMPHASNEPCWDLRPEPDDLLETTLDESMRKRDEAGDRDYDSQKSDN